MSNLNTIASTNFTKEDILNLTLETILKKEVKKATSLFKSFIFNLKNQFLMTNLDEYTKLSRRHQSIHLIVHGSINENKTSLINIIEKTTGEINDLLRNLTLHAIECEEEQTKLTIKTFAEKNIKKILDKYEQNIKKYQESLTELSDQVEEKTQCPGILSELEQRALNELEQRALRHINLTSLNITDILILNDEHSLSYFSSQISLIVNVLAAEIDKHFSPVTSISTNSDCEQTTKASTTVESPKSNSMDLTNTVDAEQSKNPISAL